jgi:hypothetical protein
LNLSQVSKVFRTVINGRKREFFLSAYAKEFRRGELSPSDASDAITEHIKGDPKAALILFEAVWKGSFDVESFIDEALCRLDPQDRDTLVLSLYTIYDHVVLETSWAA